MSNIQVAIVENLLELVQSTCLSWEFCNELQESNLITRSEYQELTSYLHSGLNTMASTYLYTNVARKFTQRDEAAFMQALLSSKNDKALEILNSSEQKMETSTSEEAGEEEYGCISLENFNIAETNFLKDVKSGKYNKLGKFEGLNFADEETANELWTENEESLGWDLHLGKLVLKNSGKKDFMYHLKRTMKSFDEGTLWWNPRTTKCNTKFTPRNLRSFKTLCKSDRPKTVSEFMESEEDFLFVADSPGMGKSTLTTKLEEIWRKSFPTSRIIIRINLKNVHDSLQKLRNNKDEIKLTYFLQTFVPYIPVDSIRLLHGPQIKVIILLDGLDDICPLHEDTMLRILKSFLRSSRETAEVNFLNMILRRPELPESLKLGKIFLTTRPHLRALIENEFGVQAYSFLPLNSNEQVQLLLQEVSSREFCAEKAEKSLKSLSSSAVGNPLMLFLLSRIIRMRENVESRFFDQLELYERFVYLKHSTPVVETGKSYPKNVQNSCIGNLLEENLPYYYAVALNELIPSDRSGWPTIGVMPKGKKLEELLGIGLLVADYQGQVQFFHKSFAEFFYARLLVDLTTSVALRGVLFRRIYWEYSMSNVEEFVFCWLRRKQEESPCVQIFRMSKFWLQGSKITGVLGLMQNQEWLPRNYDSEKVLGGFLKGRLFVLLAEDILSISVDINDPRFIKVITQVYLDTHEEHLMRWLIIRDPIWTRRQIFGIYNLTNTPIWSQMKSELVIAFLCANPEALSNSLTPDEILKALNSCENFIEKVRHHSKFSKPRRMILESQPARHALKKAMLSEKAIKESLVHKETAWWMAELLTKDELYSLLTDEDTRVTDLIGTNPRGVESVWGEYFLGDLLTFRFKFGEAQGKSVFEGEGRFFVLEELWGRLIEDDDLVTVLRQAVLRSQDYSLLELLEEKMEQWSRSNINHGNIIEKIVGDQNNSLWDQVHHLPFEVLPFVIRYGTLQHVKKYFNRVPPMDGHLETMCTSLVLSLLMDDTDSTYKYVLSLAAQLRNLLEPQFERHTIVFLIKVPECDLRKLITSCSSRSKFFVPLVCQISWGEIVIKILKLNYFPLKQKMVKQSLKDFLKKSETNEMTEVLELVLQKIPSLLDFLFLAVIADSSARSHSGRSVNFRMQNLLKFLSKRDEFPALSWIQDKSDIPLLMNVIVEIRLYISTNHTLCPISRISDLLDSLERKLRSLLETDKLNFDHLLTNFSTYKTEVEWEAVLEALQLQTSQAKPPTTEQGAVHKKRFCGDPVTPLLRVWQRHFGVQAIETVLKDTSLWREKIRFCKHHPPIHLLPYLIDDDIALMYESHFSDLIIHPQWSWEPLILAVELGSLEILEEVGMPSLLSWRDDEGRNLLEIAVVKLGKDHDMSRYLQEKFQLSFNSNAK